ncbi:hypothetical protein GH714_007179 [Hevea brasiliensis]|uniref:RNA-dependent RNA polymerase n=1 Tax=Hevea brasiliensis TaxID=3981 RepID=A0A6A6M138_HEVBR|nr:hypothetical protein GH714_007179 [Hevea brasiliensis]
MMGCLDETGTLEYGQVFVQYSCARNRQFFSCNETHEQNQILQGKVVVTKNPCLHPGDVGVLKAVDVPALHHMVDCIVFPQKEKDLIQMNAREVISTEMSTSFVGTLISFLLGGIHPDYTAAKSMILDHDVTIELRNHLPCPIVFADKEPFRAMSKECIELAKLSSIAVDFPKTGVPAKIPPHLRVKEYPDFMEKPDKPKYESQRVIGKLFRAVKDIAPSTSPVRSFTWEVARQCYDPDMEVEGYMNYIDDAFYYKSQYDNKLGNMMDYYGIKTEAEIISGWIIKTWKSFDKKRDFDAIMFSVRSLRNQAKAWFNETESDDLYAKASLVPCDIPSKLLGVRIAWMGKTIQVYGFPSNVTVDEVKGFLESYTGEGTVYAMKIREKGGPRKYAIVQFTIVRAAEYIISLTNERLWYDTSYLKARIMDTDIVPKPRTFLHSMEHITLHFGCQISKEEFYVLWKGTMFR